ncbi:MAG: hypothetical protein JXM70_20205 [Pirellulales bacterium]|nr:hypothetical protein [Pirellulales bacterium]
MIRYTEGPEVRKVTPKAVQPMSIDMDRYFTDGLRLLTIFVMMISLSILVVLGGTLAIMASHYSTYPHIARDVWQLILIPLLCSHGILLGIVLPLSAKAVPWRLVVVAGAMVGGIYVAQLLGEDKICLSFIILFTQMLCTSVMGFILRGLGFQLRTDCYTERMRFNQSMLALVSSTRTIDVRAIQERYQFLLRTLFCWTLALALLMSLLSLFGVLVPKHVWVDCLKGECLLFVVIPVVCAWMVWEGLGEGWRSLPTIILFVVCACVVLMSFLGWVMSDRFSRPAAMDVKIGALLVVWLIFVRLIGLRLCREGWVRNE